MQTTPSSFLSHFLVYTSRQGSPDIWEKFPVWMTENEINKNNNKISLGENQGAETTLTTDYLEGLRNFKIDNKLKNINVTVKKIYSKWY